MSAGNNGQVLDLRLKLRRVGYDPIPLFGKVPSPQGWEKLHGVSPEQIEMWSKTWPGAGNTGVLTASVPTFDADILNEEAAVAVEDLVRDLYEEKGRLLLRIGRAPKRAFLFRTDAPFKKITINFADTEEKLEFLCDGQQLVVDGIHPTTGKAYAWFGGEPTTVAREDLPLIAAVEAAELMERAAQLLVSEFGYIRSADRPKPNGTNGERSGGPADWQYLVENIRAGRDLHDSLRDLAAKLVASGMGGGAAVNFLRGLMEGHPAEARDYRWQQRFDDIPRLVDSAEKFRDGEDPAAEVDPEQQPNLPPPQSLAEVHAIFKKWFGAEYDLDAATAAMAAAASERLPGDPLWLLIVGGPGGAKTETIQSLAGCGAYITSTISSEGALLSATPAKQKSKKATGGLLRKIGDHGTLVIKDFTSILSAARETRGMVLAAVREIYDGRWERNVGSDGGQTLTWTGRIVIVAAVTTAWDAAHAVVASMGDRFALMRLRTKAGRQRAGRGAIRNTGGEVAMRQELADAVGALIAHMDPNPYQLSDDEVDKIVKVADLVTVARSAVERDYRGEVEFAHDPEAPTRFAKQLVQLLRGAVAIGVEPAEAMRLVRRVGCDSIPPLRRDILLDLAEHPGSRAVDVCKRISQPRTTVRRGLECLHMLGVLTCEETEEEDRNNKVHTVWLYGLADEFDRDTLQSVTTP